MKRNELWLKVHVYFAGKNTFEIGKLIGINLIEIYHTLISLIFLLWTHPKQCYTT